MTQWVTQNLGLSLCMKLLTQWLTSFSSGITVPFIHLSVRKFWKKNAYILTELVFLSYLCHYTCSFFINKLTWTGFVWMVRAGLKPEEKLINLGSRNFFLCYKPPSSTGSSCSKEAKKAINTAFPLTKLMDFLL